jgi:arylsulfatase A-like enzyme
MLRSPLVRTVLVLLLLAALAALAPRAAAGNDRPPNVVLILADDLGYAELGCYGQEKIRTPRIDGLAAEGMRFTQHYAGAPVCAPSRCVLLTGRHTGHAFIRGNSEVGSWDPEAPEGQRPLPADEVTLAERLRALGYATGAFGKWGLGGPGSTGHPGHQGFDWFYGYLCQRVAHNYYPTHLWRNHDVDVLHGNRYFSAHQTLAEPPTTPDPYARFRGADYAPDAIIDEALAFVRRCGEQPFFLYYASVIPHVALQVPDDRVAAYPEAWDDDPYLGQRGYLPHPRPRAAYAAMITSLDTSVGRLLDLLDELELAGDTIVMFTSDNGTTFAGGVDRVFFASLGELRGHKANLLEGGLRVPLVVRWPGRVAPDTATDHVSAFQDVVPTVLELIGADPPPDEGLDGISFAPTLLGRDAQREHDYLYWEFPEGGMQQAVRLGDWKGLRRRLKDGVPPMELYDLATDPGETTDVADRHPQVTARIRAIMGDARVPSPEFPIPALDEMRMREPVDHCDTAAKEDHAR